MKNLAKIVLPVIAVACFAACSSTETRIVPGTVVISGRMTNLDSLSPRIVTAHFQNPFDDGGSSPVASLDPADGSFRFEYEMPYGQSINIRYGNRFIAFYAEPGDDIGVTVDASRIGSDDWDRTIKYSGDKAELNTRFTPAYNYFNARNDFFDNELSPDEIVEAVRGSLQARRDSLAAYARRENLAQQEVRLIENEIVCDVLYYAAAFWQDGEQHGETMTRLFREVVDFFDPRYASSMMYATDLGWYMSRCLIDPEFMDDPAAATPDLIRKIQDRPAGLARDIMVYYIFTGLVEMAPDASKTFAPQARALLDSDYARERFSLLTGDGETAGFEPLPLEGISLIAPDLQAEPLPEVDMFRYLSEKHPGKVIYVDVAAHWCGPCINEIPHMKKLEESLVGEDVVFVTLWLESDFDSTVALMREHELRGEHYFFTTDASRLFSGNYGIAGFPTYMLIDRSGNLVDNNAGRPSGNGTAGQIGELLQ